MSQNLQVLNGQKFKMLKKYALKVSNTLSTINYVRTAKGASSSDDDGSRCSYDSNYDQSELSRSLFIENYLIGRGKARSASLGEDSSKDVSLKRNNRRKSLMEKRDDRLKINRNCLYNEKSVEARKLRQNHDDQFLFEMDDEKSVDYELIEHAAPQIYRKKINNVPQEFLDFELSICHSRLDFLICILTRIS
jgi:hypothetical protein